jgi:hypothetical protein
VAGWHIHDDARRCKQQECEIRAAAIASFAILCRSVGAAAAPSPTRARLVEMFASSIISSVIAVEKLEKRRKRRKTLENGASG